MQCKQKYEIKYMALKITILIFLIFSQLSPVSIAAASFFLVT